MEVKAIYLGLESTYLIDGEKVRVSHRGELIEKSHALRNVSNRAIIRAVYDFWGIF